VKKVYDLDSKYFAPLRSEAGASEVIPEAVTTSACGKQYLFVCCRCHTSLLEGKRPKFCRASGFRISPVPAELATLNWMESRLIGLGVSFTTCINLYCDQQEFTRGNAVNYWNDVSDVTLSLPRPISESGVVLLRSRNSRGESLVRVRPDLIRRALVWLITNNPLYEEVCISEENLAVLEDLNANEAIPSLELTEDEEAELLDNVQRGGPREGNYDATSDSRNHTDRTLDMPSGPAPSDPARLEMHQLDQPTGKPNEDIVFEDSFELHADEVDGLTEAEKIIDAANAAAGQSVYPIGELRCRKDPMNEYTTRTLMQNCFPTLFPNGQGGYYPLSDTEDREQEYSLADYCAHLMKWHDRRFVIHRNFKFFCLNLIQRRQIDGLVRRIRLPGAPQLSRQDELHGCSQGIDKEINTAMELLDSLKPYFRSVRGTGLYWANVREDVMSLLGNRVLPSRWPTFFLTLSAADTIWPDLFRACNPGLTIDEARRLSPKERRRYLAENPDIAARHFNRRFNAFFEHILCGSAKPLGEITDYFWRVEFQQRGSPHIHALLWVKESPDILQLSQTEIGRVELASYVDGVISVISKSADDLKECTCDTCSRENVTQDDILSARPPKTAVSSWQCDLARVVHRVQQHLCGSGSKCRKQSNICRFGYPKELRKETEVEVHESADGVPSVKLHLKRESPTINNYSPNLLSVWRANMDIQLVGNAYGAAEYTAAYVSKAEPDTLRFKRVIAAAVKRCDPNLPNQAILKRVANSTLSIREVSAQEAYYILLRELPLHGKSRQVTRVKVMRHTERYYRIEPFEWSDIQTGDIQDSEIRIEPVEAAYMARPTQEPFDSMSFASFVERYELVKKVSALQSNDNVWKRTDSDGYIKARSKAHVVRATPWISPDSANPNFCFAEIFLHRPWRALSDLPETDEECLNTFSREQEVTLMSELREESSNLISRKKNISILEAVDANRSVANLPASDYAFVETNDTNSDVEVVQPNDDEAVADNSDQAASQWVSNRSYGSEDIDRARVFMKQFVRPYLKMQRETRRTKSSMRGDNTSKSHYIYPITEDDSSNGTSGSMDESQWIPFALAMRQARRRLLSSTENVPCEPLQMIIHGEGGSGKSWLIRHIVKDLHNVFGDYAISRRNSKRVLLLAHQGTAAFNIKGRTICSAFELSVFSRNGFSTSYTPLSSLKGGQTKLKRLQEEFALVHLVIIDEFSVISCGMLYWIDQRMREIWPSCSSMPFGGRDVIFTGDVAQLDPVVPFALSTSLSKIQNPVQRQGRALWEGIANVCVLTSQNRGKSDPEWFAALRRLRCKAPKQEDVDLFNTRLTKEKDMPPWALTAKHIAYTNAEVNESNAHSIKSSTSPVLHIRSKHKVQLKRLAKKREISPRSVRDLLEEAEVPNTSRDRVVGTSVRLAVGAPVSLTFNVEQSAGLCNGTNGVIFDFLFPSQEELPIVLVQITDLYLGPSFLQDVPNIVPILPRRISWSKKTSDLSTFRDGIPMRLAYAMTVHKVQGLTCPTIVFHSNAIPSSSFAYVALSRVRCRNDIVLTSPLTLAKLSASAAIRDAFAIEEDRIEAAVVQTKEIASEFVLGMKHLALAHNVELRPRQ
jgi:hypothetical protein